MSRYIDADKLIADLEKWKHNPNNDDSSMDLVNHFQGIIQAEPTADVIPREFHDKTCEAMAKAHQEEIADMVSVVRCKECRYCLVGVATAQYSNGKQRIENLCEKHKWSVRADDFCSYGEREGE